MSTVEYPMPEDAGLADWVQALLYPWFGRPDWWPDRDPGFTPDSDPEPG